MAIKLTNLNKAFREGLRGPKVQAVSDLSFAVNEGEVFGFIGPNGAGKSTTIKTLLNFVFPDSGTVTIFDNDVSNAEVRKDVGYLAENPCYYKSLTADELLAFGAQASGIEKKTAKKRIDLLLEKVQLTGSRKRPLRTYSKGMVQRAGIALALVHDPKLVILDEPMSGLDPIGRKLVGDLILEMKEQGKTVFFSSHILNDAERFCDRVGIIVAGRLRRIETVETLLQEFPDLESAFLYEVDKADKESL
ncbi:MAG: ABC transporter ATP-binding protein [Deltaproteobacteria bacterium]|nr:ABC transporter ATP-binding protein [Deltaproteobacteria bacterium]